MRRVPCIMGDQFRTRSATTNSPVATAATEMHRATVMTTRIPNVVVERRLKRKISADMSFKALEDRGFSWLQAGRACWSAFKRSFELEFVATALSVTISGTDVEAGQRSKDHLNWSLWLQYCQ